MSEMLPSWICSHQISVEWAQDVSTARAQSLMRLRTISMVMRRGDGCAGWLGTWHESDQDGNYWELYKEGFITWVFGCWRVLIANKVVRLGARGGGMGSSGLWYIHWCWPCWWPKYVYIGFEVCALPCPCQQQWTGYGYYIWIFTIHDENQYFDL